MTTPTESTESTKFEPTTLVTYSGPHSDIEYIGLTTGELEDGNLRLVDVVGFDRRGFVNAHPAVWVPEGRCWSAMWVEADRYLEHAENAHEASEKALEEARQAHELLSAQLRHIRRLADELC